MIAKAVTVRRMRLVSFLVALAAIAAGAALLGIGWGKGNGALLDAGGTLAIAGMALAGASAGISTWRDERRIAQETERQEATGQLVYQLLARFAGVPWDGKVESELRARVAVWGSPAVVDRLRAWNEVYSKHVPLDLPPNTPVDLSPLAAAEFREATAAVAHAVRQQFSPKDKTTVEQILGALFNTPLPGSSAPPKS